MWTRVAIASLVAAFATGCTSTKTVIVQNQAFGCADLRSIDAALYESNWRFFNTWRPADYQSVIELSNACHAAMWSDRTQNRNFMLDNLRAQLITSEREKAQRVAASQEQARRDNERKLAEQQRHEAERVANQEALNRKAELERCQATPTHQLYFAQESVIDGVGTLADWKEKQAHQRRISREAGVRDLLAERNIGEMIVQTQDDLSRDFSEYRRLGGKASSPSKVTHAVKDPCASASES